MRNLIEEIGKAKISQPLAWLENQMRPQQMCDSRVAITSADQQNHLPKAAAVSFHLAAGERAQCISAPDVTWACVWCLVLWSITPE